jgi:hypothetical protein
MNIYKLHSAGDQLLHHDEAMLKVPDVFWHRYGFVTTSSTELKKREKYIARHAYFAYIYAYTILHKPFPEGEEAIAQDPECAYWYAQYVLKAPFPAGEAAIAKSAKYAEWYATGILKKPFLAGELIISTSHYHTRCYIHNLFTYGMHVENVLMWQRWLRQRVAEGPDVPVPVV